MLYLLRTGHDDYILITLRDQAEVFTGIADHIYQEISDAHNQSRGDGDVLTNLGMSVP